MNLIARALHTIFPIRSTKPLTHSTEIESHHREAAEFVVQAMKVYENFIPGGLRALQGKTVLEIGPGADLGIALAFAGFGANVIALDKYPCAWREELHAPLYSALSTKLKEEFPGYDTAPLAESIRTRSHAVTRLQPVEAELEDAKPIADRSVDIAHSNATLEHLTHHEAAILELGRISKAGSIGFHQVDLRDHRDDFARPLEYLTLPDDVVDTELALGAHANYYGNTPRASHYTQWFQRAGFEVTTDVNQRASADQIATVRGRLNPRFESLTDADLGVLGARFHTKKIR